MAGLHVVMKDLICIMLSSSCTAFLLGNWGATETVEPKGMARYSFGSHLLQQISANLGNSCHS